jgi:hypothetical protein
MKLTKLISLTFAVAGLSNAANVSVLPAPSRNIVLSTGGAAQVGDYAVVGFFRDFTDSEAQRNSLSDPTRGVLSYIANNFVPLGTPNAPIFASSAVSSSNFGSSSTLGVKTSGTAPNTYISASGAVNNAELVFAAGTPNALVSGGVTRGTRLFVLIYDSADPSTATELGIFSAVSWLVPTTTSTTASLPLTSVDNASGTYEVYRGAIGSLQLAPIVPEASSGILALLAGLGLAARRQR